MYGTRKRVRLLICLLLTIGVLASCDILEKHEKKSEGTKALEYLGKYSVRSTKLVGKTPTTHYDYTLVFKLLNDSGTATPIKVDITEDMYKGVTLLNGSLEAEFYTNGFNDVFILIGERYYTVKDYSPEKAIERGTLKDYDFVDQLYTPQD